MPLLLFSMAPLGTFEKGQIVHQIGLPFSSRVAKGSQSSVPLQKRTEAFRFTNLHGNHAHKVLNCKSESQSSGSFALDLRASRQSNTNIL